ncbi:MAG TPA: glycosyltransferase [Kiritimatiellia bacterium]|nr:glycosyltransferase [Kiritimatiellia bacterium]
MDPWHQEDVEAWRRVLTDWREGDALVWTMFWHSDSAYFESAARFYQECGIPLQSIWVLGNTLHEVEAARSVGFSSSWVNHNAWLDERVFTPRNLPRRHRAVMVCQLAPYKRIHLACNVRGLIIVCSALFHGHQPESLHAFEDVKVTGGLSPQGVADIINQSGVGLILSAEEGACRASSEYLLCGIPVVSTPSLGGRDVFYTPRNSRIVPPDPQAIAQAVDTFLADPPDPRAIREHHLHQSREFRQRFATEVLEGIYHQWGIQRNATADLATIQRPNMLDFHHESSAQRLIAGR